MVFGRLKKNSAKIKTPAYKQLFYIIEKVQLVLGKLKMAQTRLKEIPTFQEDLKINSINEIRKDLSENTYPAYSHLPSLLISKQNGILNTSSQFYKNISKNLKEIPRIKTQPLGYDVEELLRDLSEKISLLEAIERRLLSLEEMPLEYFQDGTLDTEKKAA